MRLLKTILYVLPIIFGIVPDCEAMSKKPYTVSEKLLDAIEQVESNGNILAIGDGGRASGSFQLHRIYVDEVNRILGHKHYGYTDRTDPKKSRMMTRIYLTYWAKHNKLADDYSVCRLHNGGSNGHKKQATIKYANKVMKAMR